MHARDARQFSLEMRNNMRAGIIDRKITECPLQEIKNLRLVVLRLSANLDQLDKIGGCFGPQIISANPGEGIPNCDLAQGMQVRFATDRDRKLCLEKQIKSAGEWTFWAASPAGDGLDHTHRISAPGDDQAGVAQSPFAQKDAADAVHARTYMTPHRSHGFVSRPGRGSVTATVGDRRNNPTDSFVIPSEVEESLNIS